MEKARRECVRILLDADLRDVPKSASDLLYLIANDLRANLPEPR